ncbi:MAG: hypothetical protein ACRC0X_00250 [Brevinema sp.]
MKNLFVILSILLVGACASPMKKVDQELAILEGKLAKWSERIEIAQSNDQPLDYAEIGEMLQDFDESVQVIDKLVLDFTEEEQEQFDEKIGMIGLQYVSVFMYLEQYYTE